MRMGDTKDSEEEFVRVCEVTSGDNLTHSPFYSLQTVCYYTRGDAFIVLCFRVGRRVDVQTAGKVEFFVDKLLLGLRKETKGYF